MLVIAMNLSADDICAGSHKKQRSVNMDITCRAYYTLYNNNMYTLPGGFHVPLHAQYKFIAVYGTS